MPNFHRTRYNSFIDNAEDIYKYLNGNYMDKIDGKLLDQGEDFDVIDRMQFIHVLGYRQSDPEYDFDKISAAMRANLQYCYGRGAAFGYFVISDNHKISIYLGLEGMSVDAPAANMVGGIPDISFSKDFISPQDFCRLSANSGIINGNILCKNIVVDKILSTMSSINGIIALLAIPMEQNTINEYTSELSKLKRIADDLLNGDNFRNCSFGGFLSKIDDCLKNKIAYYDNSAENFWEYCIRFGSENPHDRETLGNTVRAVLNGENVSGADKLRCYYTINDPINKSFLSIPLADYNTANNDFSNAIRKPSLISYISTSDLASIVQFPVSSFNGFDVAVPQRNENALRLFDTDYNAIEGILLGHDVSAGSPYSLKLNELTEHALITGATGAGKTNTVLTLAKAIHGENIPLLIIEPSKKEYWRLVSDIRKMKIYSFGQDAEPLCINPLIPEEGININSHISSLLYAFSAAFEMEAPTELALDGLLKYTYKKFKWSLEEIAYHGDKRFPQISDLLEFLPEYTKSYLPYGDEVKSNIFGSLYNRLTSLDSSISGSSSKTKESICGKDICSETVLIELDDLSLDMKPFLTMLIIIKAEQYLRQRNTVRSLQNVIVLEEAHNIFANVTKNTVSVSKKKASDVLSNMLSQIRAYGTGIIIADQGASQINDTAVANTKIKIIHGTTDRDDIEKIAFALNLSDIQKNVFPLLPCGEAIVSMRGEKVISRIMINKTDCQEIKNIACIFCPVRLHCGKFNSVGMKTLPKQVIYEQEIYDARFDPFKLKSLIDTIALQMGCPEEEKLCLLGCLLSGETIICSDRERRRIVKSYQNVTEVQV